MPFGSVFFSVARVFFVSKLPSPWPSTGELKFWSAATWNSYWSAPGTGLQANGGSAWNRRARARIEQNRSGQRAVRWRGEHEATAACGEGGEWRRTEVLAVESARMVLRW